MAVTFDEVDVVAAGVTGDAENVLVTAANRAHAAVADAADAIATALGDVNRTVGVFPHRARRANRGAGHGPVSEAAAANPGLRHGRELTRRRGEHGFQLLPIP